MSSPRALPSTPRTILARTDVGAAGHIVQRSDLTTHHIGVEQATLILVEEGLKRIRWSGGEATASPGEALSLQPGQIVDISNTPGSSGAYRALWICWSAELVASATSPGRTSPKPGAGVVRHRSFHGTILESYRRAFDALGSGALPASIASHRLAEVLLWLAERGFRFSTPPPPTLTQRIRGLLATDPAADWSMETVARETATSIATLRRRLADEGVSFREVVQDVRMGHALALLQNTDTSVLNIALATGYASPSRFTARFRARFGYLPTDIRGEHRGRQS